MILSDVMEDYLKAIYHLQEDGEGERVGTSEIADALEVTSPTVTSMIEKLEERGLVDREKYRGVTLTEQGERVALEVVRHHRLLEAYLTEHLDYDWSEVHDEADRLEHHISEDFEARLAAALDDPDVDPHGSPIPGEDLEPPGDRAGQPLAEREEGDRVAVTEVDDRDPEVLAYLADHGVEPETTLLVEEVAPFGMVTVHVEGVDGAVSLPERVARTVRVRSLAQVES